MTSCSARRSPATTPDLTEENLQARIRGNLLMALSNKFGWLVLTTGNKTELSVGYSTLYGDMAGGFAVLKDVFKGWVYRLVRWRNEQAGRELIPASVIERPPSAELRADQRDDDSLPPYELLDAILEGYVEEDLDAAEPGRARPPRRRGRAGDLAGRRAPSTSAARRRPGCGSRRARSAATGGCRSRTSTRPSQPRCSPALAPASSATLPEYRAACAPPLED